MIPNITIEITAHADGRYKSITDIKWVDIPGFAILTGKNGSGKTQLMEVLAYFFSGASYYENGSLKTFPLRVSLTGATYGPDEIGYLPSAGLFSVGNMTSVAEMLSIRRNAVQQAQQYQNYITDINSYSKAHRLRRRLGDHLINGGSIDNLESSLPEDFGFMIEDLDVTQGLAHYFLAYRVMYLESIDRGNPGFGRDGKPLGPAPWEVVNEALTVAGFPYEVVSPQSKPLMASYQVLMRDKESKLEIQIGDLSSGEKVLLQLVLWLFSASRNGLFPKLLLLDEPDAHLHPSMTTQFLDVILEVLVNRYGVRVIMSTHSPSTVSLAPEGSIFQIDRGSQEVKPVQNRGEIVSILTAGMVTVSRSTKFCFVEDEDDVEFYNVVRDILTDFGPSVDPMALKPIPSIAFVPASLGSGTSKISGGCTVVSKWVDKLDADPLDRMFFGIIDRDVGNQTSGRVHTIGRYSFENYLLDPLVVFSLLLEDNIAPSISGVRISSGDEHLLRNKNEEDLQKIADRVCLDIKNAEQKLAVVPLHVVNYTVGVSIEVPDWVINHQGHDLLQIVQRAYNPRTINPPRLRKALRRCRMVPKELASLLKNIQNS
ncbi:ATP-binding protein [Azospirillum melinis]|uniref:ATP-binding protein n=1 Tax=Azospirillum melinis TaxID=328839 RepID=UPI0037579855